MRLRLAALGALVALVLAGCARPIEYPTLADARAAGAVEQGFVPDGLPANAGLITIESDSGRPAGDFHFSSAEYAAMVARFAPLAVLPEDPLLQSWVKRKDLAGYQAYTAAQGKWHWLLLCSERKGRCYFRRLDRI